MLEASLSVIEELSRPTKQLSGCSVHSDLPAEIGEWSISNEDKKLQIETCRSLFLFTKNLDRP